MPEHPDDARRQLAAPATASHARRPWLPSSLVGGLAVYPAGVELEQDGDAVSGAAGDLGRGGAGVQLIVLAGAQMIAQAAAAPLRARARCRPAS